MNDVGLLILRLVTASYIATHGIPKLKNGESHAKAFEGMGFHPGAFFATLAGGVETSAAVLMAVGALGPVGPMMLFSDMIVAVAAVSGKEKKFNPADHEIEALYGAIAAFLALSGPGRFSVDGLGIGDLFNQPVLRALSLPAGIAGACMMLAMRSTGAQETQEQTP